MSYLDLEAVLETPFVHPGGAVATAHLLSSLRLLPGERALDVGCGTGATAAEAARSGIAVVGLELRAAMLAVARRRSHPTYLVRADAGWGLPFADETFDAVWAESVVALLDPPRVVADMVRVLRPGGRLALNERIWRPGTTATEAARVNALSVRSFGIPAAAVDPLDRGAWSSLLTGSGLRLGQVTAVDDLHHHPPTLTFRERLARQRRYLSSPGLLARSLRWRWLARRHRADWSRLESCVFVAERSR
jgi:SAM-dependent methyltransferase